MSSYRKLLTWHLLCSLTWVTSCVQAVAQESTVNADRERFFFEKIEPLLKSHCFKCHSHAGEINGGLTLDSRSGWSQGGDHGAAIIPSKPDESLLIKAVRRQDADLGMPPDEQLSEEAIGLLVKWIASGALDPRITSEAPKGSAAPTDWWSLRTLMQPPVPKLDTRHDEQLSAIDAFVQRALQAKGLASLPQADRRTLIRRLYFDLHGLPPTPEDVDAFICDRDPLAYQKLVDRLLDSPRYGERWARHWLDTVHFADSHGCEHDILRPNAWRYRDYVIDSLNRDTAWPRFIREQLAADYFFPDETQLTAALGFIAAGPLELSRAGTAPITFDYLDRDDMVTQTMAAFASATANCARCHDHKFDPITQQDYYSLQAVFAGVGKGDVEFDTDLDVAAKRGRWNELLDAAKRVDRSVLLAPEHAAVVSAWEEKFRNGQSTWQPLIPSTFVSHGGASLRRLEDDSLLASEHRPDQDTYTISSSTSLTSLAALRLDVLVDESLPLKGPGRQDNGNLHLSEFEAFVFSASAAVPTRLKFGSAAADWDQPGWTIAQALDSDLKTAWGIHPNVGQSHHAVIELSEPLELVPASQIVVVLKQLHGSGHLIGRLKLSATDSAGAAAEVVPDLVASALQQPRDQRSAEQQAAIAAHALKLHAKRQLAKLPAQSTVYAVSDSYSHAQKLDKPMLPKDVHVLSRGDIHQPGELAAPGALSAIATLPGRFELVDPNHEATRRAALADWLVASENPLTWRSVVNRVWSYHFGRGLCDTPNDFGRMGGTPSDPELLDWLAVWFRDDAHGSLKALHRLILCSSTYQRQSASLPQTSSNVDPWSIDRDNRLLWRANRRPLDAESYRDAVLQISGRIDLTMGGPGIQQFTQSEGAQNTPKLDYDAFNWSDPVAARRTIYRVVWRGIADPFMESLDFPDLGLLAPQRGSSVSALQSLAMFNNDFVLTHSQLLSESLKASFATVDDQVAQTCRLIYLREPTQDERLRLVEYTHRHGLAALCRILFNSNEFVFVD